MPSAVGVISPHHKIIHSSVYSTSIHPILSSIASSQNSPVESSHRPLKVVVIGGGQSAAEVVVDLRSRLQDVAPPPLNEDGNIMRHEVDLIISRGSLKPSDDSPFSNEIFNPACACVDNYPPNSRLIRSPATDVLFALKSKAARDMVIKEFSTTNYGVVNPRTVDNVIQLSLCVYILLTPDHSFTSCYTSNKSMILSLNGRNPTVTKNTSVGNPPCRLVSPSATTPLSSL